MEPLSDGVEVAFTVTTVHDHPLWHVNTRQRQQAVPQKARPRRAVATAEAKQVEVRSLRVGLQVAKQQQQRGDGSAKRAK